jgi:putative endonuclease
LAKAVRHSATTRKNIIRRERDGGRNNNTVGIFNKHRGGCFMKYVYLIQSINLPTQYYSGITDKIEGRLEDHNIGKSVHTNKFKPWKLLVYMAFADEKTAFAFERYLKSGSGRAFSQKHFR